MAAFRCSMCERDLSPHCARDGHGNPRCGWWTCTNQACTAAWFDVSRGILVHKDGRVERLGATG